MKKLKIFSLFILAILMLYGCGAKAPISTTTDENEGEQITQKEIPATETEKKDDKEKLENKILTLKTSMGDIKIELFLDKMPITAGNFLDLAISGFYNGTVFHRVINGFMIQGGDPLSKDDNPDNDGTGGPGYFIKDEFHSDFTNSRGTIAMANAGPNTGGSQFFINVADNSYLDSKHPVFGRVIEGMSVVDSIVASPTDWRDRPLENIVINEVIVE